MENKPEWVPGVGEEEYFLDVFIPHAEMRKVMNKRTRSNFYLVKILECESKNGVDYVTLVWK